MRIDDGDEERKRKEYVEDIFRVLGWLGLDWDIGPAGPDDFEKNWSQALRKNLYNELLDELVVKNIVFACECNRKQICNCEEKQLSIGKTGTALKVNPGTKIFFADKVKGNTSIILSSPFVIKRKDGIAAYQLSSLADDRHFAVTHIFRGEDLLPSTAMQLYLDSQLSIPYFCNCCFWHHPLLTDASGNKFSKSAGVQGSSIITQVKKEDLFIAFSKWIGLPTPATTVEEIKQSKQSTLTQLFDKR